MVSVVLIGTASAGTQVENVKYLGYDISWNALNMQMVVTATEPTVITVVENYYSFDSSGKPRLYSSLRILDKKVVNGSQDIWYSRPVDRYLSAYSLVETILYTPNFRTSWWVNLKNIQ